MVSTSGSSRRPGAEIDPHVIAVSIARRMTTRHEDIPPSGLIILKCFFGA
jgi:hypothetical protein